MGIRGRARRVGLAASTALAVMAMAPAAHGATIPVTTAADVSADDNLCSLREAVNAAMGNVAVGPTLPVDCPAGASAQDDLIQLSAVTYAIAGAANENANVTGDIDISTSPTSGFLTIDGSLGAGDVPATTIDAANIDRIFDIQAGNTPALEIREVILRNGAPPEASSDGGAILVRDDDAQFALTTARIQDSDALRWGGGMANLNGAAGLDIDITQVEFSGNDAVGHGGGLWVDGPEDVDTSTIRRSAFISNHTDTMGGAIYIKSDGDTDDEPVVQLINSTLSANTADVAGGGVAFAFGLGGTLFTRFSTIAGNSTPAAGQGGGIDTTPGVDEFILSTGTILAGNTAAGSPSNCDDPAEFSGSSVETGPVACFPQATIANPLLGPLSYNATGDQTTRTHALGAGSPAIDLIPSASCALVTEVEGIDQRGVARPIGAGCDAGAFEAPVFPAPPGGGAVTPTTPLTPATPPAAPTVKCKKKKKKKKRSAAVSAKCKKKKKKKGK